MKTSRRPLIGVTPDFNGDRTDFGGDEPTCFVRNRYLDAVWKMGGIPFMLPLSKKKGSARMAFEKLDGLLLTGSGPDIPPPLYGEKQKYRFPLIHPLRTEFEMALCRLALDTNLPLLGICGGTQLLNVTLKGSLIQDIPSEIETSIAHRQKEKFENPSHWIEITKGTLLHRILQKSRIKVNSSHHQSIKNAGRNLKINAVSPDGVIEGVEFPGHPFALGVQWHPEWMVQVDSPSRKIFKAFIHAATVHIRP
jgi:putative glutamine amidotransferase